MATFSENPELEALRHRFRQQAALLLQASPSADGPPSWTDIDDDKKKNEKPLPRVNFHSVFWILVSAVVTYYTDFITVIKASEHVQSWWFLLGSCLLAISLMIAFYCIIYLECLCGVKDYDSQYPALVPSATAAFIAAAICFNIALWSLWSFLTPLILFTQFMGMVMLISLLG
ncbi:transmembrane protein 128 isoform X2 [Protopterus annectens]|uniref:transmembrane protein 128 isoform X2 n=1 Tax=Protopterus annectens TaxID=7888 RepID=UPI001CFAC91E|nr:transmembrane protein 128 isoform X2 [Protopterus annectens]